MIPLTKLRRMRLLLALASGLILAFGFAPYHVPLVAWLAAATLVFVSLEARLPFALLCGMLHGVAFFGVSVTWTYTVMRIHGGLGPVAAAGVWALMVLILSLFSAAFSVAVAWISRRSVRLACVAAPFLWVTCELGRHHMPALGFPWNLLGYAVADNLALVQLTMVTGIYGLSLLVAGYGALLAWLLVEQSRRGFVAACAITMVLMAVPFTGPRFVPNDEPQHTARLVQTNLPQGHYPSDWMEKYATELNEIQRLSVTSPPAATRLNVALIVWPESPAPFYLQDNRFAARVQGIATAAQSPVLVGHIAWKPEADGKLHPYNSAALVGPAGERPYAYDKIHLVPFGEYVPWKGVLSFAEKLTQEVSDFRPGTERTVGQLPGPFGSQGAPQGKGRFATLICYEAIFPGETREFVAGGAELLVNISNDGWFGRSLGPDQHLAIAQVRAVENRRWLLRATNNGHTVAVDPYGRIVARMEPDVRGAIDVPFAFRSDRTLYTRFGGWLEWLCVAMSVAMLVLRWKSAVGLRKQGLKADR